MSDEIQDLEKLRRQRAALESAKQMKRRLRAQINQLESQLNELDEDISEARDEAVDNLSAKLDRLLK